MYGLINENLTQLLASINRTRVIDPYLQLQMTIQRRGVPLSEPFKDQYRRYWAMNPAWVSDLFQEKYFHLLETYLRGARADVTEAALILMEPVPANQKRSPLQFSFATKLVHIVKPDTPIYDSNVCAFYFLRSHTTVKDPKRKLQRLTADHQWLAAEYERVLRRGILGRAIDRLRKDFELEPSRYSDTKAIDTLVWRFVTFMRKQPLAQRPLWQGTRE